MEILSNYKLGDKVAVDTHNNILVLSNSQMRQYSGLRWICSICRDKGEKFSYLDNTLTFHCHKCEYDLCLKCISEHDYRYINNKMIEKAPSRLFNLKRKRRKKL